VQEERPGPRLLENGRLPCEELGEDKPVGKDVSALGAFVPELRGENSFLKKVS